VTPTNLSQGRKSRHAINSLNQHKGGGSNSTNNKKKNPVKAKKTPGGDNLEGGKKKKGKKSSNKRVGGKKEESSMSLKGVWMGQREERRRAGERGKENGFQSREKKKTVHASRRGTESRKSRATVASGKKNRKKKRKFAPRWRKNARWGEKGGFALEREGRVAAPTDIARHDPHVGGGAMTQRNSEEKRGRRRWAGKEKEHRSCQGKKKAPPSKTTAPKSRPGLHARPL